MGNFYIRCEVITGYPSGDSRVDLNANSMMNALGFTFEEKEVIHSLYKGILPLYMGNIGCEVITEYPSSDSRECK